MIPGTEVLAGSGEEPTVELTATAKLPGLIERATDSILLKAKSITIRTDEDYVKASEFGTTCKQELDRLEAERMERKSGFLREGKRVDDHYRLPLATLAKAVEQVKAYMLAYNAEKKRLAAIEQKRLDDERAAAAAEAKRVEEEALAKIREEEQARLKAAEAEATAERQRREAAEAEARKAEEEKQAALARAAGDRVAAEAAEKRAGEAEEQARVSRENAAAEREKAIEARRAQLRAERATAAAVQTMETATAVASQATQTALATPGPARVKGAGDRITVTWKWRLKPGADIQTLLMDHVIPLAYVKLDDAKIDALVGRLKDLAQASLPWLEIYSEESLALKGKK